MLMRGQEDGKRKKKIDAGQLDELLKGQDPQTVFSADGLLGDLKKALGLVGVEPLISTAKQGCESLDGRFLALRSRFGHRNRILKHFVFAVKK